VTSPDLFTLPASEAELATLEEQLRIAVVRGDPFLDDVVTHLIIAGGKRIRPALALAAASLSGSPASANTIQGGIAVELVHLASLYHDDVMDEALIRRQVPSVNARWGNLVAIVAGDFLLARSAEIAASLGAEIGGLLAATLARLCQGQIAETRSSFQIGRTEADYLRSISDKTSSLMATACRIGSMTAHLPKDEIEALAAFGECFGVVFQIRDDVRDVLASEQELGKVPGQDLAEGIYTLPVIRALRDPGVSEELRGLLGRPLSPAEVEIARGLIMASGGIPASVSVARQYAEDAAIAAQRLGDGPVVKSLTALSFGLLEDLERSASSLTH
jgi:heptaprenyl diphosphate synthase